MILVAGFAAHGVAAQVSGVPHVGLLHWTSPAWAPASGEFREGMRSLGWIEGSTIMVEAILHGRQPAELTATRLTELDLPLHWTDQRRLLVS
jgi:hypothetical protein